MTIIILLPCRNDYKKYSPRRGTDHAGRVGIYGQKADRRGRIADPYGVMQPRNVFCTVERGDDGWQTEKLAFSVWTEHGRVAGLVVRASKKPPSRRDAFFRFDRWFSHHAADTVHSGYGNDLMRRIRLMETISIDGAQVAVQEVARPQGWDCRLLETMKGHKYILGYLVSVGPYKIDVERFHRLTEQQTELYKADQLQLGSLARELAGEQR